MSEYLLISARLRSSETAIVTTKTKAGKSPRPGPRPRLKARDRRSQIVAAALEVVAEHGFHGTSTRELARRAGVSEALVFRHFPTKEDLIRAILADVGFEERIQFMESHLVHMPPRQALQAIAEHLLTNLRERPDLFRVVFFGIMETPHLAREFYQKFLSRLLALETRLFERAFAEHGIREARAALAPTLRLGASYVRNNEAPKTVFPNPVTGSTTVVRVGSAGALDVRTDAQLTLYSGGRNGALVSAAEAARSGELHGRRQADADLVLRVSQAFYRVIAAGRLEDAADDALASAEAHRRTSAARVRAGAAPRLDSLQAHVDLAARTTAKVKASEAVHLARVDLETAIGVPLDPAERLVEPGTPALDTPADSATAEQALRARPELAAYDEAIRENAHRARAARAARSPLVQLNAASEYLGPNRDDSY